MCLLSLPLVQSKILELWLEISPLKNLEDIRNQQVTQLASSDAKVKYQFLVELAFPFFSPRPCTFFLMPLLKIINLFSKQLLCSTFVNFRLRRAFEGMAASCAIDQGGSWIQYNRHRL